MDNKKDTQGHQGASSISINSTERFAVSLSKKSERLATALYLVTNFLSDDEPLKFRLRSLSLVLVQKVGFVRYGSSTSEKSVFEEIQGMITETLALLELAFIAGIVSEMNFTILKREYISLRDATEVKKVSRESRTDSILGNTFFGSSFAEFESQKTLSTPKQIQKESASLAQPHISIGHPKGQKDMIMSDTKVSGIQGPSLRNVDSAESHRASHPSAMKQRSDLYVSEQRTPDVAKEARRTRILKLVKDNREVTIKDISNHFPELSEKTIQRELVSLAEAGVLKKFGERRWSRYALA